MEERDISEDDTRPGEDAPTFAKKIDNKAAGDVLVDMATAACLWGAYTQGKGPRDPAIDYVRRAREKVAALYDDAGRAHSVDTEQVMINLFMTPLASWFVVGKNVPLLEIDPKGGDDNVLRATEYASTTASTSPAA